MTATLSVFDDYLSDNKLSSSTASVSTQTALYILLNPFFQQSKIDDLFTIDLFYVYLNGLGAELQVTSHYDVISGINYVCK